MLDKLNDQEKSILLFKAMGWHYFMGQITKALFVRTPDDNLQREAGLYDPANMSLAWKVLNWATEYERKNNEEMVLWWMDVLLCNYPPADAQRLWLDKILELAIEAGLVEVDDVA